MEYTKPAIASGHPLATQAAARILRQGGNAFDAVIAAGFASSVVEPALTSLGGGGFLLAKKAGREPILYDFFVDTPGKGLASQDIKPHFFPVTIKFPGCDQVFNIGPGAVAVPGNLKGFFQVHRELGRLSLAQVVEPAREYAKEGTKLNHHQAYFLSLLEPIMLFEDYGKEIFLQDGSFIKEGQILRNPLLAKFLERLGTEGEKLVEDFYCGAIAQKIVKDMERLGGLLTLKDLAEYEVKVRQPLKATFQGFTLLTNPPPSFGGFYIALALELISRGPIADCEFGSTPHLMALATTMREVEEFRKQSSSNLRWPDENWFKTAFQDVSRAFFRGTTHVSVCDGDGNMASMTTSNGEGSGYFAPDTGIMLNNMMGEDDLHPEGFHSSPPGLRVASMMSPSLLMEEDKIRLVLGSGGSKRIRSAITQVVINTCFLGLGLEDAICHPRIHLEDGVLQVEPGFSRDVLEELAKEFKLNVWNEIDVYFGGVHAVSPYGHMAQGDPRRGGASLVLDIESKD